MVHVLVILFVLVIAPLVLSATLYALGNKQDHWRSADRSATGLSPDPVVIREAVVQIFASRAYRWRGIFAVHSWIAVKPSGAVAYTRFDVMGWGRPLRVNEFAPDGRWFGRPPDIIYEARGDKAAALIPKIIEAVNAYPHGGSGGYVLWPGPNSNSFVAWVARRVPALDVHLPPLAVGKDFGESWVTVMRTPSNTGWQVSFNGYFGVALARIEGIELHILGNTVGLDLLRPAVKLPGLGRLGMPANA